MKKISALSVIMLASLSFLSSQTLAQSPTAYVQGILNNVLAIQNNPAYEGPAHEATRGRLIHQIIAKSFDFAKMVQDSLGSTYHSLSPGQRREFTDTFSYLFQDSYTRLVLNFLKKENIEYKREQQQGGQARVDTILVRPNERIPVDYLMHRRSQNWLLYDVIVDGVSILENYRTQFARVIKAQSFGVLLQKMKTQRRAIQ
jgi:phospholipid transport system substrate-binding protein